MRRSSCWVSMGSGVVRLAGTTSSPIMEQTVPIRPVLRPASSRMDLTRKLEVVLPLVPVMPMQLKALGGMAVKRRGDVGNRQPHVLHQHLRNVHVQLALHHQCRRALLHRLRRKVVGVAHQTRRAEEQRARRHLSRNRSRPRRFPCLRFQ